MTQRNNKLQVVIGLGKTGVSCIRYLIKEGFTVIAIDSRLDPPFLAELKRDFPQVEYYLGGFDHPILKQVEEVIISPGISLSEPVIKDVLQQGVRVIGDIELFARKVKKSVIAITGSNGKSTVTTLVGEMLRASNKKVAVGGNLGTAALDLLDEDVDYYVLELSSFQLETTYSLQAQAAAILNISEDHMDRYATLSEYLTAKQRIYTNCQSVVVNLDEPTTYAGVVLPKKVTSFSQNNPKADFKILNCYLMHGDTKILEIGELKIKGMHNAMNALAALALGYRINTPISSMVEVLKKFPGLPHRCQWLANAGGVDWYNDSKGTNVGATKSAIEGLGEVTLGKIVLIAGGIGKGADFSLLANSLTKYVKTVILLGKDADLIERALTGKSKFLRARSMKDAVQLAADEAESGDIVLLSPACSSLDMFKNFEDRGNIFIEEVEGILG